MSGAPVLEVAGLRVVVGRRPPVVAVDDVALAVGRGEILAVVGASGSGKTTLARAILGLARPAAGVIRIAGDDVAAVRRPERAQAVLQDPYLSLDPRLSVERIVAEPLECAGRLPRARADRAAARAAHVAALLARVGLPAELAGRRPAALSGGERQRVALARALALDPPLLVLDEPFSSLDAPAAARLGGLLRELGDRTGVSQLVISHDLAAVARHADRIAVMDAGRIVETSAPASLVGAPASPAARELVRAAQVLSPPPWAWPGATAQA